MGNLRYHLKLLKMKNLAFILIPILFLGWFATSCKSDDDNSPNVDRIVDSWEITDVKANGVSVYEFMINTPEGCFLNSKVQFFNDFTLKSIPYELNDQGNCVAGAEISGTWSRQGDVYTYTIQGETPDSQTVNFVNNNQFYYSFTAEEITYQIYFSRM